MRLLITAMVLALGMACTEGEMEEPLPPTPSRPLVPAEPRTLAFERVTELPNAWVYDLDLSVDGRSAAVLHRSASSSEVWIDTGDGTWSMIFEIDERLATSVALEDGGDRLLVGTFGGTLLVLRDDGTVLRDRMTIGVPTEHVRQVDWKGERLAASRSTDNGSEGGVVTALWQNPAYLTWREESPRFETTAAVEVWDGPYGAHALSISSDNGFYVAAGVAFSMPGSLTERSVSGSAQADSWLVSPTYGTNAPGWGAPKDWGGYPGRGGVDLYRSSNQSVLWATGPEGTTGLAELTAEGASGVGYAVDIDADGFVWLGTDQGLFRSTEVLRTPLEP